MKAYDELKRLNQWVGWQTEERNGKATKIPKNPHTGGNALSNTPSTWADVNTAWRAVKQHGWSGLGFVFTIQSGIVGVDLDNCFDGDALKPWADDIYRMLDSFTEYSPSGRGLHIFVRGEIPSSINKSTDGVEMYNELRYFTMTGKTFGDERPLASRPVEIAALHAAFAEPAREPVEPRSYEPGTVTEKQVADAIKHIPRRMDYYDWLRVLMAVHDEYPDGRGIAICEAWSPGYEGEVARKFRSFDRTSKSGVTIATLFHMAKKNGWQNGHRGGRRTTHLQKMKALAAA